MQVWLSRMDGHMGLANSLALKIAGITNDTRDPVGGTIVKTNDGGEVQVFKYFKNSSSIKWFYDMLWLSFQFEVSSQQLVAYIIRILKKWKEYNIYFFFFWYWLQ